MNDIINHLSGTAGIWTALGLTGSILFASRWFVQAAHSRKHGKSVVPTLFWFMSAAGSIITLIYFIFGRFDLVGIISNFLPLTVSVYNLYLIWKDGPETK